MSWEQAFTQFPWNTNMEKHLLTDFLMSSRRLVAKTSCLGEPWFMPAGGTLCPNTLWSLITKERL